MILRLASPYDLPQMTAIIEDAKAFLKAAGTVQWQTDYPNATTLKQDIDHGLAYVLEIDHTIAATLAVDFQGEPAYAEIKDGQWLSSQPYAVVHRMAVASSFRGQGLSKQVMRQVELLCLSHGISCIKVDSHTDNPVMHRLLKQIGYTYCGVIHFEGLDLLAYEKSFHT